MTDLVDKITDGYDDCMSTAKKTVYGAILLFTIGLVACLLIPGTVKPVVFSVYINGLVLTILVWLVTWLFLQYSHHVDVDRFSDLVNGENAEDEFSMPAQSEDLRAAARLAESAYTVDK